MGRSCTPELSPPGLTLRVIRRYLDLKQADFGKMVGLSYSQISRLEAGKQTMSASKWRAIMPVVALGARDSNEHAPVHILATFREPTALWCLSRGVGAMFADGDLALRAAALLDALDADPIFPLPVWVSWLDREWDRPSTPSKAVLLDDNHEASSTAVERAEGRVVSASDYIAEILTAAAEIRRAGAMGAR